MAADIASSVLPMPTTLAWPGRRMTVGGGFFDEAAAS
jgi:hypothetical protein